MAKKQTSKSSAIREILASQPKAAMKEIQAELAKRHIKASAALVSKIKYGRRQTGKTRNSVSKADAIRGMWSKLGVDARPRDVMESLAKRGVKVSSAQVSTLRRSNGEPHESTAMSLDHLLAAKRFVAQVGGADIARRAIEALEKVLQA